jgi:hypothetical protein
MPTQKSASGVSANAVRDFLLQAAELANWKPAYVQKTLGVDGRTATTVLNTLAMAGYVERDTTAQGAWRNTAAGNAMAGVSKARPIKRQTAERNIEEFLARVRDVNLESQFLYSVQRAAIFGPYLLKADTVKNVDIGVELVPKTADRKKLEERVKADADRAEAEGKRFKSYAAKRAWGQDKVWQHLKGRTRALSVVPMTDTVLAQPHRVIYDRSAG